MVVGATTARICKVLRMELATEYKYPYTSFSLSKAPESHQIAGFLDVESCLNPLLELGDGYAAKGVATVE